MSGTTGLLYTVDSANAASNTLDTVSVNGTVTSSSSGIISTNPLSGELFTGVAVNVASNNYFITMENSATAVSYVYRETLGVTPVFTSASLVATAGNTTLGAMTNVGIDSANNILYYAVGTALYADRFGSSFNNTPTLTQIGSFGSSVTTLAYDQKDATLYAAGATTTGSGSSFTQPSFNLKGNYIYKISGVTKNLALNGGAKTTISVPITDGEIKAITIDTANDTLYFTTGAIIDQQAADVAGIYALNLNNNSITTIWSETFTVGHSLTTALADMTSITIDPLTGDYYVTAFLGANGDIYTGNVGSGAAPAVLVATSSSTPTAVAVIDPPGISSIAVSKVNGSTATTGVVTTSGSVTISVTFSQIVNVAGTPTLTLNDGGTASYVSGAGSNVLVYIYTPASGQNTSALAVTGASGTITDTAGGTANLTTSTVTFAGLVVETTPPTIVLSPTSSEALQGGASLVTLTGAPVITDINNTLTSASVTLSNYQSGDVLSINGATSGTLDSGKISYSAANGVITLTGTDSVSAYEAALGQVTYRDTGSDSSSGAHPTRTLIWHVGDSALSASTSSVITIDRAPSIVSGGATASLVAGGVVTGAALTGDSDLDGDSLNITAVSGGAVGAALSGTYGVLTLNANGSYSYSASNSAALAAAASGSAPVDHFTFSVSDGKGGVSTETLSITIDRDPIIASGGVSTALAAGGSVSFAAGAALAGDTDPDGNSLTITALSGGSIGTALSGTYGVLTLSANGAYSYDASNIAAIAAAATGGAPVDYFTFSVSDGQGGVSAETLAVTIDRALTISTGSPATYTPGSSAVAVDATGIITDPDGDLVTGATLYATNGNLPGDVLSFTANFGITGTFANGTLVLSGTASAADYQAVLQSVQYSSTDADPYANGANPSRTVDIVLTDAHGTSAPATALVDINSGTIDIGGGTLRSLGSIENRVIDFTGAGTLELSSPGSFGGSITDFGTGDTIMVDGLDVASVSFSNDTLSLLNGLGNVVDQLLIAEPAGIATGAFHLAADGSGGTDITLCFYPGTRIATPDGEMEVEALNAGNMVLTSDGPARLRWVGQSHVAPRFADRQRNLPIRIRAGALGDGLPLRDLLVSPDHALFLEGVLAHASALVNGSGIIREQDVPECFTYYHLELDHHALLIAEGALAESFVDNVERAHFHNWDERTDPDHPILEMPYPRAKSTRQLPLTLRERLMPRAVA